jgi:nodulation protein E
MRRVVVTGLGVICSLGHKVAPFWEALVAGRPGISDIKSVDTSTLKFHRGAEVIDFDPLQHLDKAQCDMMDRFAQFAVIAAREALADAGVNLTPELGSRTAVTLGSCVGGQSTQDVGFQELYRANRNRVHPLTIARTMMNAGTSHICMDLGVTGPAMTISTACSSSNHAIGQALWMVRSGQVDMALAGGSEAPFSYGNLKAWEAMRVVSPETCRPFSKNRNGLILGEGGAVLVLEPYESAVKRGAKIYAEIAGFGMSADAHHVTQPTVAGPASAMRQALKDGQLKLEDISYVNAHGTATTANDCTESAAINEVFGAHAPNVHVSSTKSMHGHTLGAAGAIEAVATVLALHHQMLPPTANFTEADPACNVNLVINEAKNAEVNHALSNSFAFGGLNAVLAFSRA